MIQNTDNQRTTILIAVAIGAILVSRLPLIGKYFRGIYTLIHEMAHALLAVLTSGKVLSIELFSNTEGKTTSSLKSGWSHFLVALAGYPVASVAAFLFVSALATKHDYIVLYSILIINLLCLILFIRNLYGFFWLMIMSALCAAPLYFQNEMAILAVVTGLTTLVLWESVIAPFHLVLLSFRDGSAAGDATSLKEITHLPAFIWALAFSANAVYWVYRSYLILFTNNAFIL